MNSKALYRTTWVVVAAFLIAAVALGFTAFQVFAGHNGAVVSDDVKACDPTTISAEILDPAGTHKVANMSLVVDDGDSVQSETIPTDGTSADIMVGPFLTDTTIDWRVFGGGERDYDQPAWNGYPGFVAPDLATYIANNGDGWTTSAGTDDANPFTTWESLDVPGCYPVEKDDCKDGGWEAYGFKNQGQCVRFVETGKDSR